MSFNWSLIVSIQMLTDVFQVEGFEGAIMALMKQDEDGRDFTF